MAINPLVKKSLLVFSITMPHLQFLIQVRENYQIVVDACLIESTVVVIVLIPDKELKRGKISDGGK